MRDELLVLAPNWLGDAVMATPFCAVLKEHAPEARITLICKGYVAGVFRRNEAVDRVLEYGGAGVGARARSAAASRPPGGYDACFVLPPSFAAGLIAALSRARRRIGFGGELRGALLTDALPAAEYRRGHLSRAYLRLIERFTGRSCGEAPLPRVGPPDAWREIVRERTDGREYFVLAPGATYGSSKVWPHERYAAVARQLAVETGWAPLIVGGIEERTEAEALLGASAAGINCAGVLDLEGLIAILHGSRVVIGNDSGPAHVAAALGVPTVAIFGPTSLAWTAPRGPAVRILHGGAACSPCFQRECPSGSLECMRRIEADDVRRAALSLLKEDRR